MLCSCSPMQCLYVYDYSSPGFNRGAEKLVQASSLLLQAPECSCLCPSLASTVTYRSTCPLLSSSLARWGFW